MNANLRIAARGAAILGWGVTSIGGGIYGGERMADARINSAPYLERQADKCLQSLGATAAQGPMPEDCKRVLIAVPLRIHPPLYQLPSAEQVNDLPDQQTSRATQKQENARGLGLTLGGLVFTGGLPAGKLYERRRRPKKELKRSPAQ